MNIEIKNKIIIISSPSGAGKTTLCKMLLKKLKILFCQFPILLEVKD